jgi:hypothetical protein
VFRGRRGIRPRIRSRHGKRMDSGAVTHFIGWRAGDSKGGYVKLQIEMLRMQECGLPTLNEEGVQPCTGRKASVPML